MDSLRTFIDQARAQGWDDARIRDSLLANGWSQEQVAAALYVGVPSPAQTATPNGTVANENPEKNYLVALLLSHFLGGIGADRFYLGKISSAIIKLLTFGGLGVWSLIDLLLIAFGKLTAKDDPRMLEGYAKNRGWVKIVAIVLIVFNILAILGVLLLLVFSTMASVQNRQRTEHQLKTQQQSVQDEDRSFN